MKTLRRNHSRRQTQKKKEKRFIMKQMLGDNIYLVQMKSNNQIIVMKQMVSKVEKEIHKFLSEKKERNIPSLLCHGSLYIGMERLQGTLLDYFRMVRYNDIQCFRALITILKNLKRLQDRYLFMHRDLHGGNIMFNGSYHDPEFYFIDFEYAYIKKNNHMIYNVTKSDHYRCIHSFNGGHDIRMLYISLYQVLYNQRGSALYRFLEKYVGDDVVYDDTYSSIIHEDKIEFYPDNMIKVLSMLIL